MLLILSSCIKWLMFFSVELVVVVIFLLLFGKYLRLKIVVWIGLDVYVGICVWLV